MNNLPSGRRFSYVATGTSGGVNCWKAHLKNPASSGVDLYLYRIEAWALSVAGTDGPIGWTSGRKDSDLSVNPGVAAYIAATKPYSSYQGDTSVGTVKMHGDTSLATDAPSGLLLRGT